MRKLLRLLYYPLLYCLGAFFPKVLINRRYKKLYGRPMNWHKPVSLNEKILWLEYKSDTTQWSKLADKYRVREFVKERGLEHILVKLYGVWERPEDIDFDALPSSFVMKINNGSGDAVIVHDKSKEDVEAIRKQMKRALKARFGVLTCEPHYRRIRPCILAEELLPADTAFSSSMVDYKMWCFNGKPSFCLVCSNRDIKRHTRDLNVYDLSKWESHPEYFIEEERNNRSIPRPENLEELVQCAAVLAAGFKEVRVDLYSVKGKVYFGEMTFTSDAGFLTWPTPEFLDQMGSQFDVFD